MTQLPWNAPLPKPAQPETSIADSGSIRVGGGFRLPAAEIADNARIRVGGGFRLPNA